jgi:hypothetical protein
MATFLSRRILWIKIIDSYMWINWSNGSKISEESITLMSTRHFSREAWVLVLLVCLDSGSISTKIVSFEAVTENNIRVVIFWKKKYEKSINFWYFELVKYYLNENLRIVIKRMNKIINYLFFILINIIYYYYYWRYYWRYYNFLFNIVLFNSEDYNFSLLFYLILIITSVIIIHY